MNFYKDILGMDLQDSIRHMVNDLLIDMKSDFITGRDNKPMNELLIVHIPYNAKKVLNTAVFEEAIVV